VDASRVVGIEGRPRILVLEDDTMRVRWLRSVIADRADLVHVATVLDFVDALARLAPPTLVILDYRLGTLLTGGDKNGHTGLDAARAYRGAAPVLIWTNDTDGGPAMFHELRSRGITAAWVPATDVVNVRHHVERAIAGGES
jgi:CheY-like chemotaxis protein